MSMVPLTHDDLTVIAKHLREWERLLTNGCGGYKNRADLVSRMELLRPGTDSEVIGHFVLYDGWVGFVPLNTEVE